MSRNEQHAGLHDDTVWLTHTLQFNFQHSPLYNDWLAGCITSHIVKQCFKLVHEIVVFISDILNCSKTCYDHKRNKYVPLLVCAHFPQV